MTDKEEDITTIHVDKGKSKERQNNDLASTPGSSVERLEQVVYPPNSDDAEETRRVEENLRRWEVAERQRRKAARESQSSIVGASLVSDVSRRASLLFSGKRGRHHSVSSLGNHTALRSQDSIDVVPLNRPSPSDSHHHHSPSPIPSELEQDFDPFANPQDIPLSPFDDSNTSQHNSRPLLREQSSSSSPKDETNVQDSSSQRPPPVKPLNLPPPLTPPPIDSPPPPISPPTPTFGPRSVQEGPKVRWWHEWLCGCSEGPDRGGQNQAGATNPNE